MKKYIGLLCIGFISCTPKPKQVSIILTWNISSTFVGFIIAKEQGFYLAENLDVTILPGAPSVAEKIINTKKSEFGISYMHQMAVAREKGMNIKTVATLGQHSYWGITVYGQTNISSLKEIQGHTLGIWGYQDDFPRLSYLFEKEGLDLNSFKIINVLDPGVPAFGSGDPKAPTVICSVKHHYYTKLISENKPVAFLPIPEIEPQEDTYSPLLIAHDDYIEKESETIQAFLRATEKGYRYAYDHPEKTLEILNKYGDPSEEFYREQSLQIISKNWFDSNNTWGLMSRKRWEDKIQYFRSKGTIKSNFSPDDLVASYSFIEDFDK